MEGVKVERQKVWKGVIEGKEGKRRRWEEIKGGWMDHSPIFYSAGKHSRVETAISECLRAFVCARACVRVYVSCSQKVTGDSAVLV